VVDAVRRPFMIWILILALYLAADASTLPENATFVLGKVLLALWVLSFTVVAIGTARNLVRHYGRHFQSILPVTSLTENLASLAILITSLLILLNMLGISITPILTALGVGGLAVALALQDTLANLFAGFYISVAFDVRTWQDQAL
jgi:small-conductance mechanosensitive channel